LGVIISEITPDDPSDKNIRLFSQEVIWDIVIANSEPSIQVLQEAIQAIYKEHGVDGIIDFARKVEHPQYVGHEFAYANPSKEDIIKSLDNSFKEDNKVRPLHLGYCFH
jgi:hypothetical protein